MPPRKSETALAGSAGSAGSVKSSPQAKTVPAPSQPKPGGTSARAPSPISRKSSPGPATDSSSPPTAVAPKTATVKVPAQRPNTKDYAKLEDGKAPSLSHMESVHELMRTRQGPGCWARMWNFILGFAMTSWMPVAYYYVGYGVYNYLEGWSLLDSAYFLTVTSTTVGYGDLYPTTDAGCATGSRTLDLSGEPGRTRLLLNEGSSLRLRLASCWPSDPLLGTHVHASKLSSRCWLLTCGPSPPSASPRVHSKLFTCAYSLVGITVVLGALSPLVSFLKGDWREKVLAVCGCDAKVDLHDVTLTMEQVRVRAHRGYGASTRAVCMA